MVEKWIGEFKRGRTSTNNAERSRRPKDVTTPEMIEKFHDIVLADSKVKVRELAEAAGILIGSVARIETRSKTVGRARWNCTKTSKDTTISWKGYGF